MPNYLTYFLKDRTRMRTLSKIGFIVSFNLCLSQNIIDSYLLHWPSCNPNVDWMHCQDSIDPEVTWIQS